MKRIFISYRRKSSAFTLLMANALSQHLEAKIFIDFKDIDQDDFERAILTHLRQSDVFLLMVTEHTFSERIHRADDWVRREIQEALGMNIPLVLVCENGLFPPSDLPDEIRGIAKKQGIKVYSEYFDAAVDLLVKFLGNLGVTPKTTPTSLNELPVPEATIASLNEELIPQIAPTFTDFNPTQAVTDFYTAIGDQNLPVAEALLKQIERYKEQFPTRLKAFDTEDARQTLEALKHQIDREQEYHQLKTITATHQPKKLRKTLRDFWRAYSFYDPDNLESLIPDLTRVERGVNGARHFTGTHNTDWTPIILPLGEIVIGTPLPAMEMCLVPVGSFMMGSEDSEREKPIHLQTVSKPYWIARYPVTNTQWHVAVKAKAVKVPRYVEWYNDPEMEDCPVVWVTWHQALAFAQWVGCTLPSELETEYAARGLDNLIYPWGNNWEDGKRAVWKGNREGEYPHPVTSRAKDEENGASWVGAMHLSGNVWEWQRSEYKTYPYNPDDGREDLVSESNNGRILRGGSWRNGNSLGLLSSARGGNAHGGAGDDDGFRVCCYPHLLRL